MYNAKLDQIMVCSLDIKNIHGMKDYDIEKYYREAGHKGSLVCPFCGDPVILRSGDVRIPYFAHKKRSHSCENKEPFESEVHRKGIHILYQYFTSRGHDVTVHHKFDFNRWSNLYISDLEMAVEFIASPGSFIDWEKKHKDYLDHKIMVIYIASNKSFKEDDDYNFFEMMLSRHMEVLYSLDEETLQLNISKYLEHVEKNEVYKRDYFSKAYPIEDLEFNDHGFVCMDFELSYVRAKKHFHKTCKEAYVKEQIKSIKPKKNYINPNFSDEAYDRRSKSYNQILDQYLKEQEEKRNE